MAQATALRDHSISGRIQAEGLAHNQQLRKTVREHQDELQRHIMLKGWETMALLLGCMQQGATGLTARIAVAALIIVSLLRLLLQCSRIPNMQLFENTTTENIDDDCSVLIPSRICSVKKLIERIEAAQPAGTTNLSND